MYNLRINEKKFTTMLSILLVITLIKNDGEEK